jgi:hypothetical protein
MYLPGPMSGTITQIVAQDMVPPPLDLSSTSRSFSSHESPRRETPRKFDRQPSRNSFEDFLVRSAQRSVSMQSSLDAYNNSPIPTPVPDTVPDSADRMQYPRYTEEERRRIISYASEKYVGIKPPSEESKKGHKSKTSSLSQRAGSLMRALSTRKGSADSGKTRKTSDSTTTAIAMAHPGEEYVPGSRKKLAIQPTSYQLYGEAAWEKEDSKGKKKRSSKRSSNGSNRSSGDGSGQKMGFFEGAKHKLTRTASEKRREKLKDSIKLVGPTQITKDRHAREDPRKWWE